MGLIRTSLTFSQWAFEFMLIPRVLATVVLALISLIVAAIRQNPFKKHLWKPYHWLVLTHLLFFPAAIIVGVIWTNPVTNPTIPHRPIETVKRLLDILWYASLASSAWWIWRMKGFRWFAASLMVLAQVPVLCSLFVAEMSVAGDWL